MANEEIVNVSICNTNTNVVIYPNKEGFFKIEVSVDDVLVVSSFLFEAEKKRITIKDYTSGQIEIFLRPKIIELNEIIVDSKSQLNAYKFGIIQKPIKTYTYQEKKFYSETSGLINSLISSINGNRKRLNKNIEVEKKEIVIQKLMNFFGDDFFLTELKIPKDRIRGFYFYIVEDASFMEVFKSDKKDLIRFWMTNLAIEYNKT